MDRIKKLLQKVSQKERAVLEEILKNVSTGDGKTYKAQKLQGGDLYKIRKGRFRVLFHFDNGEAVIDSIRLRSEKTYKNIVKK
jgi:mRNA-degrading endonuclease RelE of RelBE toxin-antitoxin system